MSSMKDPIFADEAARDFRRFVSRHSAELMRYLNNLKYEWTQNGMVIAGRFLLSGHYFLSVDEGPWRPTGENLVPTEGRNAILESIDKEGSAALNPQYFILGSSSTYTPAEALTMATFNANAVEVINYSESTRQKFVAAAAVSGVIGNTGNEAVITSSAPGVSIWIVGLSTSSQKGGSTGKLTSVKKLDAAETLNNIGSTLRIKFERTATNV